MHHSWMDVMYCGSCHGLRLELFWTSSATSDMWNHRFWFIHGPVDSFLANCDQGHIFLLAWVSQPCFHEIFSFRWKTLKLWCSTNVAWDFSRHNLLTSISQWWTFLMTVTGWHDGRWLYTGFFNRECWVANLREGYQHNPLVEWSMCLPPHVWWSCHLSQTPHLGRSEWETDNYQWSRVCKKK